MRNCDNCGGKKWIAKINKKTGLQEFHKTKYGKLRVWKCWRCNHVQHEESPKATSYTNRIGASILYLDIESSLSKVYNYGLRVPSKYISPDNLISEYFIICWSASYVGDDKVFSGCVTSSAAKRWDDGAILKNINALMHSADILAGHNIDAFDIKKLNTRFLFYGLEPVINKKTLDTLKIARQKFSFESNKLDWICQRLGLRGKDDITSHDWREVVETGNRETLSKILKYNQGDVINGKNLLVNLMRWSGKKEGYGAINLRTL